MRCHVCMLDRVSDMDGYKSLYCSTSKSTAIFELVELICHLLRLMKTRLQKVRTVFSDYMSSSVRLSSVVCLSVVCL